MRREVGILIAVMVFVATTSRAANPSVSLTVTDMGLKAPISGVNVRVRDGRGKLRDKGATDGNGVFVTTKVVAGETVTLEYELAGYVRRPERLSWKVVGPADRASGALISRTNQAATYLRAVAEMIDAIAASAPTASAKKLEYTELWDQVAALPTTSQQAVGRELDGKQYLVDIASFQNAVNDGETSGRANGKTGTTAPKERNAR